MASHRITVRVNKRLVALLRHHSRVTGESQSEVVRVALQTYLGREVTGRSAYELAKDAGLIGCVRGAPRNLSTNRCQMEDFKRDK